MGAKRCSGRARCVTLREENSRYLTLRTKVSRRMASKEVDRWSLDRARSHWTAAPATQAGARYMRTCLRLGSVTARSPRSMTQLIPRASEEARLCGARGLSERKTRCVAVQRSAHHRRYGREEACQARVKRPLNTARRHARARASLAAVRGLLSSLSPAVRRRSAFAVAAARRRARQRGARFSRSPGARACR